MIGDGKRVAVAAVAELELALEVDAPQIVGLSALRQRRSRGAPSSWDPRHQAMPIKHGMDGAPGGYPDIAGQAAHEQLADLAGAPVRLVLLGPHDHPLDRVRQLVGIANRSSRSVGQCLETMLPVTSEDLVSGLSRDAELPADPAHRLAVQLPSDQAHTLLHHGSLLPRHRHLRHAIACRRCYPCLRYRVSPMSRAAQETEVIDTRSREG